MASTVTGICNRGLQRLGTSNRILDITDDTRNGRACNTCYDVLKNAELRKHYWNFAKGFQELGPLAAAPDDPDYQYQFLLPADCLKIIKPVDPYLDWQIRGRHLLSNDAIIYLNFIKEITDPNLFDTAFSEMLSMKMAYEMCEEITQSTNKQAGILRDYEDNKREAKKANAFETIPVESEDGSWLLARL